MRLPENKLEKNGVEFEMDSIYGTGIVHVLTRLKLKTTVVYADAAGNEAAVGEVDDEAYVVLSSPRPDGSRSHFGMLYGEMVVFLTEASDGGPRVQPKNFEATSYYGGTDRTFMMTTYAPGKVCLIGTHDAAPAEVLHIDHADLVRMVLAVDEHVRHMEAAKKATASAQ